MENLTSKGVGWNFKWGWFYRYESTRVKGLEIYIMETMGLAIAQCKRIYRKKAKEGSPHKYSINCRVE